MVEPEPIRFKNSADTPIMCPWINKNTKKLLSSFYLPTNETEMNIHHMNTNKFNNDFCVNYQPRGLTKQLAFNMMPFSGNNASKLIKQRNTKILKINQKANLTPEQKETRLRSLNTKFEKQFAHRNDIKKTMQFTIPFTKNQRSIVFKWFDKCDYVYNSCVEMFNKEPDKFNQLSKSALFNQLFSDEKGCPYDTLTDEYSKFLTNLKSAFTNLNNGNIKHFQVTPKKRTYGRSMYVSHRSITNNGIFPTLLGEISNYSKILDVKKIECDCRLVYLNKTGKFYLHVPQYVERKIIVCRDPVCSIDPGEKVFISTYSVFESGKIGEDIRKPILAYQSNIKQYQKVLSSNKNKNGTKLRNKRSLKKKIQQQYDNIHNLVRELHNQTANYLCKSYDNIIIPRFETQKMVKTIKPVYTGTLDEIKKQIRNGSKKIRLSKRVKFVLNMLSHYKFRQHLEAKCDEYGCNLEICGEEYTTQCCGKCGFLSKRFEQRTKICTECGYKINRDINGARNILIKNYKSVMDFKKTE